MSVSQKYHEAYHNSFLASVERNQIPMSRFLLTGLYLLHVFYKPFKIYTSKFIHLQYAFDKTDPNTKYDIGFDDIYYVINWVISLTFLRSFIMQYILSPCAFKFFKIRSTNARIRFAEQGWSFIYYSSSFLYGIYLYYHSPYYFNVDNIYIGWPHNQLTPDFKRFYLISIAFWIQQIFVLNIEKPRKDHYQMFSHHIITCLLIIGSYYYYFVNIGHMILMIMDSVDINLAAAKMLKYAGFSASCDAMFIFFLISWVALRHGVYNYLFYHAWTRAKFLMPDGECVPGIHQKRCWTPTVVNIFLTLLGGLQIITIIWMYLIMKVAYKVVTGTGAEDVRSDDDDTDVEDEDKTDRKKKD